MRALIAFDKFKDALSAEEAGEIARAALLSEFPDCVIDHCPLTDGGEGFVETLTNAVGGKLETRTVAGPRGDGVDATIGFVEMSAIPAAARAILDLPPPTAGASGATLAVLGMSSASGLALLPSEERDPWQTSSRGTGQLIRAARDAGASAILLGIGGSATNDLGAGALAELGLTYVDRDGRSVTPPVPAQWSRVVRISGQVEAVPPIRIACDVTNPLLGAQGASAVYGPQKGLRAEDVPRMEAAVVRIAGLLQQRCQPPTDLTVMPGAGAAGGIAFGLAIAAAARLVNGFGLVQAWCNLEARVRAADVVITGEGRFDATSLQGKGPGAVALYARDAGKAVHVFAGQITSENITGLVLHEITPRGQPLAEALQQTRPNLATAIRSAFR